MTTLTTNTQDSITDCKKCGGTASVTMVPTPLIVEVDGEFKQVFQVGNFVHLNGHKQCPKACNSCGAPGYLKRVTDTKRVFLHDGSNKGECA
jgi:hypothetical protein